MNLKKEINKFLMTDNAFKRIEIGSGDRAGQLSPTSASHLMKLAWEG